MVMSNEGCLHKRCLSVSKNEYNKEIDKEIFFMFYPYSQGYDCVEIRIKNDKQEIPNPMCKNKYIKKTFLTL